MNEYIEVLAGWVPITLRGLPYKAPLYVRARILRHHEAQIPPKVFEYAEQVAGSISRRDALA